MPWGKLPWAKMPWPGREMTRYYLNLRTGEGPQGLVADPEGDELAGESALRAHVIATARDLVRNARLTAIPNWLTCAFEVTDEEGQPVMTLAFQDAAAAERA